LREAGFTGVDICLKDREGEHHIMSGMIATAKEDEREIKRIRIEPAFVLIHPETPTAAVSAFLEAMTAHLQQFSREAVTTESLARVARLDLSGKSCLLLLDADCDQSGMNLADINQTEWDSLKNILVTCADATWITSGATGADGNPWASMALGLVRSFRAENPSSAVTIIDLASKTNFLDPSTISIVAKLVIAGGRSQLNAGEPHDWEYCIRDSEVLIPRAIPDDAINDAVFNCSTNPQMEKIRFSQPNKSLALANFQTMCFVDDPVYRSQPLKSDEVEIQVQTTWVQDAQNSLLSIGGEKRDVGLMGTVCGTVFRLGSAANAAWSVGDRIMTFHRGAIRNFFRVPLGLCQKIPEQLGSFRDAAKFPFIYSMAYYCLVHQASLKSGEAILIHCQRDGFDEAVISLALQAGATVFLTVSSQSRKEQLAKRYSLSQASIFNYKDTRYNLESIWAATMNRGVDVVLNHIPNGLYPEASQYLAPGGRLVQLYSHREGGKCTKSRPPSSAVAQLTMNVFHLARYQPRFYVARDVEEYMRLLGQRPGSSSRGTGNRGADIYTSYTALSKRCYPGAWNREFWSRVQERRLSACHKDWR
jgi:NADPH:quinone reductase-like Zn-dependent oxidoreductase